MDENDQMSTGSEPVESGSQAKPLPAIERRLLGVLIEKAKTTPDNYPLSLNALRTGANQKSNRAPQMNLVEEEIEEALDALRELGAATEIQGDGRVAKYRHRAYDWLGVDKIELAIMGELLLRGDQTVGELRGRAARMEPIADMAALRPRLDSLEQKELIEYLTPQGRGCVVTHKLYQPEEMAALRERYQSGAPRESGHATPSGHTIARMPTGQDPQLREEVASLRQEVEQLRHQVEELRLALRKDTE